jgi:organic hydroperoxide reductase OsmC/OhrA
MSEHGANVSWQRGHAEDFVRGQYSRAHAWRFDGGAMVHASASPSVVPAPWSDPAGVDPEEAFVASIASCHMLWFLSLAAERGLVVERYEDAATGTLGRVARGVMAMTEVILRPRIAFGGDAPDAATIATLHEEAHARCFIANSVNTKIRVEPAS